MEECYGGTDVMERSCAVARGIDINTPAAREFSRKENAVAEQECGI
jgi:hypothetical protein